LRATFLCFSARFRPCSKSPDQPIRLRKASASWSWPGRASWLTTWPSRGKTRLAPLDGGEEEARQARESERLWQAKRKAARLHSESRPAWNAGRPEQSISTGKAGGS
jgi:hypothetical protein